MGRAADVRLVCVVLRCCPCRCTENIPTNRPVIGLKNGAWCLLFLFSVHHVSPSARPALMEGSYPPSPPFHPSHHLFFSRILESLPTTCSPRTTPSPVSPSRSRPRHPPRLPSRLPVSVTQRPRASLVTSRRSMPTPRTASSGHRHGLPPTSSSPKSSSKTTLQRV